MYNVHCMPARFHTRHAASLRTALPSAPACQRCVAHRLRRPSPAAHQLPLSALHVQPTLRRLPPTARVAHRFVTPQIARLFDMEKNGKMPRKDVLAGLSLVCGDATESKLQVPAAPTAAHAAESPRLQL